VLDQLEPSRINLVLGSMAPSCLRKRVKWSWSIWWGSRVDRRGDLFLTDQISLGTDLRVHHLVPKRRGRSTSRRGLQSRIKMKETKIQPRNRCSEYQFVMNLDRIWVIQIVAYRIRGSSRESE
jgi:hypothetical protein